MDKKGRLHTRYAKERDDDMKEGKYKIVNSIM